VHPVRSGCVIADRHRHGDRGHDGGVCDGTVHHVLAAGQHDDYPAVDAHRPGAQ
jgi:hypothetical protein